MRYSLRHVITFLLLIGLLLTGCKASNGADPQQNGPAETTESDKVTLEAWIMSNTPLAERVFVKTLQPFLDQRSDLEVELKVLSWESAWQEITTAVSTGNGPDLLQLGTTWVPAIAAMDGLADLSERFSAEGMQEAYLPASWATTMISGEPNIYAMPWFVEGRALLYRKSAFEAAGVSPEAAFENWDTFKEALRQLQGVEVDGGKLAAFSITGKNDWSVAHNIFPWVWSAGGDVFTPDLTRAAFNSDNALQGIMYYTGLANEGLVDPSSLNKSSTDVETDFADGKTAMIVTGSWLLRDLATPRDEGGLGGVVDPDDVGVAPLPMGPQGRATFIGGSNLAIFKHSEHMDEAWDVIHYLSSNEDAQLTYAEELGMLPAHQALLDSPKLTAIPGYSPFAEATQYGRSYPSIPEWGPAETTLVKVFGDIWDLASGTAGTYSEDAVRKLLDDAAREVNLFLAQ
jgi:multiple sugar transport system substrate-binding protein